MVQAINFMQCEEKGIKKIRVSLMPYNLFFCDEKLQLILFRRISSKFQTHKPLNYSYESNTIRVNIPKLEHSTLQKCSMSMTEWKAVTCTQTTSHKPIPNYLGNLVGVIPYYIIV